MHFGWAAQDRQLTGTTILFAEEEHFDDERATKATRKVNQSEAWYDMGMMANVDLDDISSKESDDEISPSVPADAPGTSQSRDGKALLEALAKGDLEWSSQSAYVGKWWKRDLDMGIDFLINAEKWPGMMC
ncbi:hypothetical protein F5141DRAFT_1067051 [Pisolithus sp. B1]|nr:hypothetical protein F5141DRAFT_1067051 [Pisolithus sp. B1]